MPTHITLRVAPEMLTQLKFAAARKGLDLSTFARAALAGAAAEEFQRMARSLLEVPGHPSSTATRSAA